MAAPCAEHRGSDPPSHGSARSHACRHGADPRDGEPRQRSAPRQEGPEHGNGAAAACPVPRTGRPSDPAVQDGVPPPVDETSRSLTLENMSFRARHRSTAERSAVTIGAGPLSCGVGKTAGAGAGRLERIYVEGLFIDLRSLARTSEANGFARWHAPSATPPPAPARPRASGGGRPRGPERAPADGTRPASSDARSI